MSQKPVLYSYWRSSCAWRVRIALNWKGIDYDYKTVNLLAPQELDDISGLNPAKKVPVLVVDGDNALFESIAIIEYIEETHPERPLLPKCPVARAKCRAIALQITAGIQPLQNLRALKFLNAKEAGSGQQWAKHWLEVGLKELEEMVAKTHGRYTYGDEVTYADLFIPSIMYNAKRFGLDTATLFPVLSKVDEALAVIPEFVKAIPDNQPDANLNA